MCKLILVVNCEIDLLLNHNFVVFFSGSGNGFQTAY